MSYALGLFLPSFSGIYVNREHVNGSTNIVRESVTFDVFTCRHSSTCLRARQAWTLPSCFTCHKLCAFKALIGILGVAFDVTRSTENAIEIAVCCLQIKEHIFQSKASAQFAKLSTVQAELNLYEACTSNHFMHADQGACVPKQSKRRICQAAHIAIGAGARGRQILIPCLQRHPDRYVADLSCF